MPEKKYIGLMEYSGTLIIDIKSIWVMFINCEHNVFNCERKVYEL